MLRERWLTLVSPLALLVLWEVLARLGALDVRFFSMPSEIFARLVVLLQDGTLLTNTAITLRRVAVGFVLATVPAILLGVIMGVSGIARALFTPLVAAIYPIPKIALVPMVVLLLGIGEPAKYAIVVISVFFLVVLNTVAGVRNVDARYFDIARNHGASQWDLIWTVALPGALPSILTGVNLGLGFALTVIVGTELLLPRGGLGAMIWAAYQVYDIPTIFAALIVVALLGFAANWLMGELERQLVPWRVAESNRASRTAPIPHDEPRVRRFVRVWWMATRPFSFTASVVPVTLGAVLAAYDGHFDLWLFVLALVGSVLIHAGTNLANDYYDWKKGADTPESLGPNRALQEGMLTPRQVFIGALVCFGVGSLIGLYLVAERGIFILLLGVLSVLAGWFYTAGPKAFAYIGLGEIVVFIFMGPVMVIGSYYVQAQAAPLHVVLLSLPIGFLVAAILHANNMRDLEGDLAKNKRTLANILGRQASKWEYLVLVSGSFIVLTALVLIGYAPLLALLPLLALPMGVSLVQRAFATDEPRKLNRVLRATANLHSWFGGLMILGFIGAIVGRLVY
ncbi:MAG: 1,4-dihydroxy-2-naphthoate octaprenyltransferase [Thermoflexales bacterium]|nr:1,4-dihydroxy-2-naphthoate octaprenyltransferase [Thermoflexales bacterium]MDW8351941.1 1,4-dihydroxy-2-naphthoate octaprenyltransferase [Anaerolineae bacterium]